MEGDIVEIIKVGFRRLDIFEFLLRVIYESAELAYLLLAERCAEDFLYFTLDIAGSVFQYMAESLALSMEVGYEMLCPFGQVEDCLKIYDFCAGRTYRAEILRQKFEHSWIGLDFRHG